MIFLGRAPALRVGALRGFASLGATHAKTKAALSFLDRAALGFL